MKNKNSPSISTCAIHSGYDHLEHQGALCPPIYMTSTFGFSSADHGAALFSGEQTGHFYTRISNPTLSVLESKMAALELTESALAVGSGMAAISATFWSLLQQGDEVVVDKTLYGCTFAFFDKGLSKFGIKVHYVDFQKVNALQQTLNSNTRIVYFETPANPTNRIIDIHSISSIAHSYNSQIKVIVDNTYCSPALQQPIKHGADIVIHSATKYLGGHGDLIAGIICSTDEVIEKIRLEGLKDMTGAALSPLNAFLILRGLKTLDLRVKKHCKNALKIAKWLASQPQVNAVFYPGLEQDKGHHVAKKQMRGFTGMVAFELSGGYPAAIRFMDSLSLIIQAVSLGDAETLCQHPASMTHSTYTPEQQQLHGISPGLIRISAGLESFRDIKADLKYALQSSTAKE